MEQYSNVVQDLEGNVVPEAVVRVLLSDGGANAAVYDSNGAQAANPVPCDTDGYFAFQAANGKYFAQVEVGNRVYKRLGPLSLYDPDADTNRATIAGLQVIDAYMTPEELADARGANPLLDHSAAFVRALAVNKVVNLNPLCIYNIKTRVTVGSKKTLNGNNATVRGVSGVTAFHFVGNHNRFKNVNVESNGSLYFFRNDGRDNWLDDHAFSGDVGHYIFCPGAVNPRIRDNAFNGEGIYRIVTSVVLEDCRNIKVSDNQFVDIEHWCIQVRGRTINGSVTGNICSAAEYTASVTATAGQTVFNFAISNPCHLAGIQVNGTPYDVGLTFSPALAPDLVPTRNFTVTFATARAAGEVVKLIAHRAAENIQINGYAVGITIGSNTCEGGGDSGILIAGFARRCVICGNIISRIAYAGISLEGGVTGCSIYGNIIWDCSLITTAATYSSGVLLGGGDNSVYGNTVENTTTPPTMRYGVSVNTYDFDDGSADKSLKIGLNTYIGPFRSKVYIPNQDGNQKRQSIEIINGLSTKYPERPNLDSMWTNGPADTAYWKYSGFGGTIAIRDTSTAATWGGVASLKTVAGEYLTLTPTARAIFANTLVKINFWARNNSGSSYVKALITLAGSQVGSPAVAITDTTMREYTLTFPITPDIDPMNFVIQIGADSGSANIDYIDVEMTRIP